MGSDVLCNYGMTLFTQLKYVLKSASINISEIKQIL